MSMRREASTGLALAPKTPSAVTVQPRCPANLLHEAVGASSFCANGRDSPTAAKASARGNSVEHPTLADNRTEQLVGALPVPQVGGGNSPAARRRSKLPPDMLCTKRVSSITWAAKLAVSTATHKA